MKRIQFFKDTVLYNPDNVMVVHLCNIQNENELFNSLKLQLKFPYFGFNWNALYDLLRDFHWIEQKGVVIVHDDWPKLEKRSLDIYMNVLIDSVLDWKEGEDHYLEAVFPEQYKGIVEEYFKKKV